MYIIKAFKYPQGRLPLKLVIFLNHFCLAEFIYNCNISRASNISLKIRKSENLLLYMFSSKHNNIVDCQIPIIYTMLCNP